MQQPFSLQGRVALITGGGTGIGFDIAKCFLASGATVIITGRRVDVLKEAIANLGAGAHYEIGRPLPWFSEGGRHSCNRDLLVHVFSISGLIASPYP
jgi:NAD(P)-dependent dehydrogenase (short-subunit alcohol dehydrogenase family)